VPEHLEALDRLGHRASRACLRGLAARESMALAFEPGIVTMETQVEVEISPGI